MNLHAPERMTKEAFLGWVGEQEGPEFIAGLDQQLVLPELGIAIPLAEI